VAHQARAHRGRLQGDAALLVPAHGARGIRHGRGHQRPIGARAHATALLRRGVRRPGNAGHGWPGVRVGSARVGEADWKDAAAADLCGLKPLSSKRAKGPQRRLRLVPKQADSGQEFVESGDIRK